MSIYKNGKLIAGGRQCMPLFSFMWADHELNDVQWLRADTFSWQSGAVYQAAFIHIWNDIFVRTHWTDGGTSVYTKNRFPFIGEPVYSDSSLTTQIGTVSAYDGQITVNGTQYHYNYALPETQQTETIEGVTITYYLADDGHKICPASQESNVTAIYNATGVAWYYIIDSTNKRFKLPRTQFTFTGIRSGVGGYVEAGLPNITGGIGLSTTQMSSSGAFTHWQSGGAQGWDGWNNYGNRGFNFDASRSSPIYGNSDTVQPKATEMYLYFYVGNFTQTALENTAGLSAELFNGKADVSTVAHVVTEFQEPTSANNYTWYRKYADGWVEQGGGIANNSTTTTVTLPVAMANTNYTLVGGLLNGTSSATYEHMNFNTLTTTSFKFTTYDSYGVRWQVSGMAA